MSKSERSSAKRSGLRLVAGGNRKQTVQTPHAVARDGVSIEHADSLACYGRWPTPACIIADGPYGLGKFPGEPHTVAQLPEWYAPHVAAWSAHAGTDTTLWFWCSEVGWAMVHSVLELNGWQYEECCVWDKGLAHVAGNCNSKTIRGMPVVTEVAVRYTKRNLLRTPDSGTLALKEWVRHEWQRSGLPMNQANRACGVANAATRKYLTQCHLWYFPPPEAIVQMADYCNRNGAQTDWPYFSLDGENPVDEASWARLRAKWNHSHGLTNVWQEPAVHGPERIKLPSGYLHANQKPLALMRRQILASTDAGDVVWEPFGGLCSASMAALETGRRAFAAEVNADYFKVATARLNDFEHGAGKRERVA